MGRNTWATDDQVEFLNSYLDDIPKARSTNGGLTQLYARAARDFLQKWEPQPITTAKLLPPDEFQSPEELKKEAIERLNRVCALFQRAITSHSPTPLAHR